MRGLMSDLQDKWFIYLSKVIYVKDCTLSNKFDWDCLLLLDRLVSWNLFTFEDKSGSVWESREDKLFGRLVKR